MYRIQREQKYTEQNGQQIVQFPNNLFLLNLNCNIDKNVRLYNITYIVRSNILIYYASFERKIRAYHKYSQLITKKMQYLMTSEGEN